MNIIESTLLAFFSNADQKPIVVAYSGGVDSQVLLAALSTLKQQNKLANPITVCHVHHGLSINADDWQQFAVQQCQQFSLPLVVHKLRLEKQPQQSLEAIARDARYQHLVKTSTEPAFIVTGHHLNDQTETFLLALKRGSGLKGLSAMASHSRLAQHTLIRPLLEIDRKDIVNYAEQKNLSWIEDESNQDQAFDRNFIRHSIVPELVQRWPSFNKTLSRSASHCQDAQLLLDELAEQDLTQCLISNSVLNIEQLQALSQVRFNHLIRYFLAQHDSLMPSTSQLSQLYGQLSAEEDKTPEVKVAEHWLRRYQGALYLTTTLADVSAFSADIEVSSISSNSAVVELPDNLGSIMLNSLSEHNLSQSRLDDPVPMSMLAPKHGQTITLRFTHNNPKCLPDYRHQSRPLKKVLQELAIPPWQRKRIPFIYYDNELVAAVGHFVCKAFMNSKLNAENNTDDVLSIFWKKQ